MDSRVRQIRVLAPQPTNFVAWVTLSKSHTFSEPQSPHYKNGDNSNSAPQGGLLQGLNGTQCQNCLKTAELILSLTHTEELVHS